nr:IS5 family transposase [Kitasatospora purpeofusca]
MPSVLVNCPSPGLLLPGRTASACRHPRYGEPASPGAGSGAQAPHQRSADASEPGDSTFSIMLDRGRKSCRAGRPGAPLRGRENGNGALDRDEAGDHALGRSRGGLSTKLHLACDGRGRPLGFVLTGGNTNDCTRLEAVLEAIRVPRVGPGRPRTRPDHVVADKGYSSRRIRTHLRGRGIPHTVPERVDQANNRLARGSRGGRPPGFDRQIYRLRNVVERCFNRLKQWRGLATRYDKTRESYQATVTIAPILLWI